MELKMYRKKILENGWYKTATPEEMRIALMHLEMNVMDNLNNCLNEAYRGVRDECFEECSKDCGWDKST